MILKRLNVELTKYCKNVKENYDKVFFYFFSIYLPRGKKKSKGQKHRSPIVIPEVLIEGHTLSFEESCIGCSITIIDENENTVFSAIVGEEGIVILPDSLVGTFVLELERGSITFEGEIEL